MTATIIPFPKNDNHAIRQVVAIIWPKYTVTKCPNEHLDWLKANKSNPDF